MRRSTVRARISRAAMGRSAFSGWRRSSSRSIQSLNTYVPDERKQNETKARIACVAASGSKTRRAKTNAAKIARFFVHCRGRSARNHAGKRLGFTAPVPGSSGASDAEVDEATLTHPDRVEDVPAVEDHCLLHELLHPVEVRPAKIVPLGEDEEAVCLLEGLVGGLGVAD